MVERRRGFEIVEPATGAPEAALVLVARDNEEDVPSADLAAEVGAGGRAVLFDRLLPQLDQAGDARVAVVRHQFPSRADGVRFRRLDIVADSRAGRLEGVQHLPLGRRRGGGKGREGEKDGGWIHQVPGSSNCGARCLVRFSFSYSFCEVAWS